MRRVALKGLWWRRGRAVLTAFAVVLGVAMVSGTFILTDTINKAFDSIFQDSYSKTSAVISGKEVVKDAASGTATVPASLLAARARQRQRRGGHGRHLQPQRHLGPDQAHRQGRRVAGLERQRAVRLRLRPRRRALQPAVADRRATGPPAPGRSSSTRAPPRTTATAWATRSASPPDGPTRQYTITGLARYGKENSIGGATIAVFDVATAQALLGKRGQYDTIFVAAKDGVSSEQLVQRPAAASCRPPRRSRPASSRPTPTPRTPRTTASSSSTSCSASGSSRSAWARS